MKTLATFLLMSAVVLGQGQHDVEDVLREGRSLVAAGKLIEAQGLYEKEIHNAPENPDLDFELGMVYYRQHNWAKAIESYQKSLSAKPRQIKTLFYLAESYSAASDTDQALETMALAAGIAPNDAQIRQKYGEYLVATLDRRKEGIVQLQKARTLNQKLDRIDFEIGKAQFGLTDYPSAAGNFDLALKKDPNNGEAAFFFAESLANLGEWEKAHDFYSLALSLDYANSSAFYGLGKALVQLGQFSSAIEPLERSLNMQPSLVQAHFQLAKAYGALGRNEDARQQSELFAAMRDRVNTSSELNSLSEKKAWRHVKPLLAAGEEQAAMEYLAALPASDLSNGSPTYLLGVMYNSMGRQEDAKRLLAIGRIQNPQDAHLSAYLGMLQLASGEPTKAGESFQAALAIDPADSLALIGMGTLEYQQQQWVYAIDHLEKSRTADPGILFMLCEAYFRIGNIEKARLNAEVVRAFGADQKSLLDALDKLVQSRRNKD